MSGVYRRRVSSVVCQSTYNYFLFLLEIRSGTEQTDGGSFGKFPFRLKCSDGPYDVPYLSFNGAFTIYFATVTKP
jgi:hypothetical protein